MEINPLKVAYGCPYGGVKTTTKQRQKQTNNKQPTKQPPPPQKKKQKKKQQQQNNNNTHTYFFIPGECIGQRTIEVYRINPRVFRWGSLQQQ